MGAKIEMPETIRAFNWNLNKNTAGFWRFGKLLLRIWQGRLPPLNYFHLILL